MKVTINNIEYNIKFNLRAMFIFEQIAKKQFGINTLFDEYVLFYSCLLAGNKECNLSFDDFIDFCDGNSNVFTEFLEYLNKENAKNDKFTDESKNVESL